MIEITQVGQGGKTKLLFDMHRLRKKVFKDRMGWDVNVDEYGLEVDQFDLPEAIYLLSLDDNSRVQGSWRLLPSTGPTMIRDVWPEFLKTNPMPSQNSVWEASRFAVDVECSDNREGLNQVSQVTQEMFIGLTEFCIRSGIDQIYTLYDARIARFLKRLDCEPAKISESLPIDGQLNQIGRFDTDNEMLCRLRHASGISNSLISNITLPRMSIRREAYFGVERPKNGYPSTL